MEEEYCRLVTVRNYRDATFQNSTLNNIVSLAAEICQSPVAIISLIDDTKEYFIARKGIEMEGRQHSATFCIRSLLQENVLTIPDLTKHKRFTNFDLGIGSPDTRFYAAASLISPNGYKVGRLFVLNQKPKQLTRSEEYCLQILASQVINCLEQSSTIQIMRELLKKEELLKRPRLEILPQRPKHVKPESVIGEL